MKKPARCGPVSMSKGCTAPSVAWSLAAVGHKPKFEYSWFGGQYCIILIRLTKVGQVGMETKIPDFKYNPARASNNYVPSIELADRVIHKIGNPDEFYKTFGYTQDIKEAGVLPDEFIWDEYIKEGALDFSACLQMHVIEYLRKYSATFIEEYGNQCEIWVAAHAEVRAARGVACVACRMAPFCK